MIIGKTGRGERETGEGGEGEGGMGARETRNEVKIDSAGETSGSVLC